MNDVKGDFETDLSQEDALAACAEAIDGLGWDIESVSADRIVSHVDWGSAPHPPKIEVRVIPSGEWTGVEIIGSDSDALPLQDEALIAELDRARDAIEASIQGPVDASPRAPDPPSKTRASGREPPADRPPTDQSRVGEQAPEPSRRTSRPSRGLVVAGLVAAAITFLLPLIYIQIVPVVIGIILLIRRQWVSGVLIVILGLVLASVSTRIFMKGYEIPSGAMEPTVDIGDHVFANRAIYHFTDPNIGDIVVFHPPKGADTGQCGAPKPNNSPCPKETPQRSDQIFIKRIVAGPGDRLSVLRGHPVVNGKVKRDEPFINPCPTCTLRKPIAIPPGHYFMMGDNRGSSDDSRFWGPVPQDWFVGKMVLTYWPVDRIGPP